MRKLIWWLALFCAVGGGAHTAAALACESTYDTVSRVASLPCVAITGGTQVLQVSLTWTGGNNFAVTSSSELDVRNPFISSLKVLATPVPVAIVYGNYSSGCTNAYGRATFVSTGNNIDIRIKSRAPLGAVCAAVLVPFVDVVRLPDTVNSQATYSVNGVAITPSN